MGITETVREGIIEAATGDGPIGREFTSIPGHEHMLDLLESDDDVIDAIVSGSPGFFPSREGITEYLTDIMDAAQKNPHGFMGFLQEYGNDQETALAKVQDGDLSIIDQASMQIAEHESKIEPQNFEYAAAHSVPGFN